MSGPRSESPFASIRELTQTERRITDAMTGMKHELLDAIKAESIKHDQTHSDMAHIGNERHRRIDDFLGAEAMSDAKRTGMMAVGIYTVRAFRFANEFRWLFAAVLVTIWLALGAHIQIGIR